MRLKAGTKYIEKQIFLLLIAVYTFLKVYRNSINYADATAGGIWNYILIVLIAISFLYMLSCNDNSLVIRSAIIYSLILWINGLLTLTSINLNSIYYYIVAPCFAPILVCLYRMTLLESDDDDTSTGIWDLSWVLIYALLLYTYIKFFGRYQYYESSERIALNNSYYAACSIPLFIRKRNRFGLAMVFVAAIIVFISNKRTGFIAMAIAFAVYYLINSRMSGSLAKAFRRLLLGIIVLIVGYFVFKYIDSRFELNVFSRLFMVFNDGGSGRTIIYEYVFNEIKNSNLFSVLFGHGVASINNMQMSLSSAHSDFLNVFYEYGLFALIILCVFYFALFNNLRKMIKYNYKNSDVFAFSLVISFFFSLFSANLDNQSFSIVLASYWAFELADWKRISTNYM